MMYQNVSQTGHSTPQDFRVPIPIRLGYMFRGLANNLEVTQNRILAHFVLSKIRLFHVLYVPQNLCTGIRDMKKINPDICILHSSTASARTFCRMYG